MYAFLLLALVAVATATPLSTHKIEITRLDANSTSLAPQSNFECNVCINFVTESLNDLIQIIANVGIAGGCSKVCGLLPSQTLAQICDIVCEIAGIEEFSKLLNEADPDPIYICERVNLCPHSTTASANVTQLTISPRQGAQGATFTITLVYQVKNTIATGQLVVIVVPPDASSFGAAQTLFSQAPGTYGGQLQFQAQPSEQEPFDPGQYQVIGAVCEGTCGSSHQWSYTLSEKQTSFTITSNKLKALLKNSNKK